MNISTAFQLLFTWLPVLLYLGSPSRSTIEADTAHWIAIIKPARQCRPAWSSVAWLIFRRLEFRSLLYYRLRLKANLATLVLIKICEWTLPPLESLIIYTPDIGPGLFIQHGLATIIAASRIGSHCSINQQVTIGYSGPDSCPTIGNNVKITAGAKVIGAVTIGDNVVVGANAVVVKDVPANCTVVGVPAYIIRRDGKSVREELSDQ